MDDKFEISNIKNYNDEYENTNVVDYIFKYIELTHKYLNYCDHNLKIQNIKFQDFVILKGLDMLHNVFSILLLYSRNLSFASNNTQKAYCYYIEFIQQIGDENNSFLKLNVSDALLFIYKKTIYNINQEYRKKFKTSEEEDKMMLLLKEYCCIYNNLLYKTVLYKNTNKIYNLKKITELIIYQNTELLNKYILFENHLIIIRDWSHFLDTLFNHNEDIERIYSIFKIFFKKYSKNFELIKSKNIDIGKNIRKNINVIHNNDNKLIKKILEI